MIRASGGRLEKQIAWLLLVLTAVFLIVEGAMNLTPPTSRDALIHHLALPKIWIANGGIIETPWADFSYYPMHIDLLYLGCLLLGSDTAPKFIHMGFGFGTGLLLLWFVNRREGRPWGAAALAVFLTTPLVVWLSTSAYVDLGMTFFTTASVLALLRWREEGFAKPGWLWVSALAMGLAAGSKYNALIAWLVVNLLVIFLYVRHSGRQMKGVGYGLLFFGLAALAASPWYIRNWLLTGNPFHPLFSSLFQAAGDSGLTGALGEHLAGKKGRISFFQMRRILYGENFWETLLIPLRMFFQGRDDSYRYFQGVLNPILIVFVPFAFLNRRHLAEKGVLAVFSVVFITVAYFTTKKQVRYLLPVIPMLTVLTTMGIGHLIAALSSLRHPTLRNLARGAVVAALIALLGFNVGYLKERFFKIDPLPLLTAGEDRDGYLARRLHHYPAVMWVNRNLPADARLFTFFLGRRGYYLDRAYRNEPSFGRARLKAMVDSAGDEEAFQQAVDAMEATHLLVREDLWNLYLKDNFTESQISRFAGRFAKSFVPVYEKGGYLVYERVSSREPPSGGRKKG